MRRCLHTRTKIFRNFRALLILPRDHLHSPGRLSAAADTAAPTPTTATPSTDADAKTTEAAVIGSQESLRSYLLIQEQLRNTQIAIEKNRQEAEAAALHNAEQLQSRLDGIQKSLAAQRLDELKNIQKSNHTVLVAAGAFFAAGFLVLFFAIILQWNIAGQSSSPPLPPACRTPPLLAQGPRNRRVGRGRRRTDARTRLQQSTTRFLSVVERLEQRIQDMEATGGPAAPAFDRIGAAANGEKLANPPRPLLMANH